MVVGGITTALNGVIAVAVFGCPRPIGREMRQEEVGLHDIFRTMPNPTEGLDEERTAAITGSVQAMGLSFGNNEKLMQVLLERVIIINIDVSIKYEQHA